MSTQHLRQRPKAWRLTQVAALTLSAALALSISACTDDGSSGGTGATEAGTPSDQFPVDRWDPASNSGSKPDLPARIGFVNQFGASTLGGPFLEALESAASTEGLEVITADPKGDNSKAIQQVNEFVQRGVVGVYDTQIAEEMGPADLAAMDTGAMVAQFNQGPVTTMLSSIQYEGGHRVGEYVASYVEDKLAGNAQIVWISQDFAVSLKPRTEGFKDALDEAGILDMLVTEVTPPAKPGATQDAGVSVMNTVLEQYPDVNVVASAADDLALGAATAMQTAGVVTPSTLAVGIDGTDPGLAAIQDGTSPFKATVAVNFPFVGYVPGRLFGRWADGLSVPQYLVFNYALIDSPEAAARLQGDSQLSELPRLYDEMLAGDDTYVTPLGSINYETHGAYYNGTVPDKLPELSFTPNFESK